MRETDFDEIDDFDLSLTDDIDPMSDLDDSGDDRDPISGVISGTGEDFLKQFDETSMLDTVD